MIRSIEVVDIDIPEIKIEVYCSGGTYIRSLAADIGESLGTVGHLISLRRLSSGPFRVNMAIKSESMNGSSPDNTLEKNMISLKDSLPDMNSVQVDFQRAKRIRNGFRPEWEDLFGREVSRAMHEGYVKLVNEESLVAILEVGSLSRDDSDWLKSIRVFN